METKFQSSFIPKTTLDPVATGSSRPMNFFSFIASIIFFISVLVAGGAFGWHKYLDNAKLKIQSDLQRNIKSFEPQTINEYVRLNARIDGAKSLLKNHVAVSYIFDFLSEQTIQSVKFSDFKYDIASDGSATLTMNGMAKSYNAVAYQSEVFGDKAKSNFQNPLFSNLDLDAQGDVIFNFTTKVDPGFIYYTRKANTIKQSDAGNLETLPSNQIINTGVQSSEATSTTNTLIQNN